MHAQSILIGLLGVTAFAEASAIHRPFDQIMNRRAARALNVRQFGGGQFGGGQFGGGNFGQGGQGGNNGQNQGNQNNAQNGGNNGNQNNNAGNTNNNANNNKNNQASLTLNSNAIQTGSQSDGDPDAADGESASKTDNANFINFCSGQTLTNGLQVKTGSCNGIPMGKIPATTKMVSSVLINPQHNDNIQANKDFDIQVQVQNFSPGTFTNAANTYYSAPQDLDGQGQIIGHTHVTVQDMGNSLNPTKPLDATKFVFFKGINDAGNGNGLLSATVTGGLPAGNYRVCTMFSAANHQPVLMPVAQRGAQDDCNKFTVGGNGNNNGNNANNANNNNGGTNNAANGNTGNTGNNAGGNGRSGQGKGSSNSNTNTSAGGNANSATQQTKNLGGAPPSVTNSGDASRPFAVNGNTFVDQAAAKQRACDIQNNNCSDAANAGASFKLSDCQAQLQTCLAA
ncbi:hypothetical protein F5Y00DRAFT_261111 [Daldinia vernicosa]|uniref:uncharacterized protein n=1 Tax=Daldinia vernicosa TaxID=114800 RepID=UPI002008836C|nr:uncharacterized protein F5Y00DRAFT_261111 [Daldinia vernicosa]KAI0850009.1 hypothetical protein F5Y00DRAFT_261111 [Daldinia vernicosa]